MKNLKKFHSLIVIAALSFGMISCSKNDNNGITTDPEDITTATVWGDYTGYFVYSPLEKEESNTGTEIGISVKNDTIFMDDFPVKDIVLSIVQDEEVANKIVEAVGKVSYRIGYKPFLSENKDSVSLDLDPEPLELSFDIPYGNKGEVNTLLIRADIEATDTVDAYVVESRNLKFKFIIREVLAGSKDTDMVPVEGFVSSLFDFDMKKVQSGIDE